MRTSIANPSAEVIAGDYGLLPSFATEGEEIFWLASDQEDGPFTLWRGSVEVDNPSARVVDGNCGYVSVDSTHIYCVVSCGSDLSSAAQHLVRLRK